MEECLVLFAGRLYYTDPAVCNTAQTGAGQPMSDCFSWVK